MTIREIAESFRDIYALAETGEIDEETLQLALKSAQMTLEEKADNCAVVIDQCKTDAAAIDKEIKRLQARKKSLEGSVKFITETLADTMRLAGREKFKTAFYSFGIQKNPAAVVLDTEDIPEEYLVPQEPKVDKTKLKEDLKAGKDLSGVAHLEQTEGLRIR